MEEYQGARTTRIPAGKTIPMGALAPAGGEWFQWDGAQWVECPGVKIEMVLADGRRITAPKH